MIKYIKTTLFVALGWLLVAAVAPQYSQAQRLSRCLQEAPRGVFPSLAPHDLETTPVVQQGPRVEKTVISVGKTVTHTVYLLHKKVGGQPLICVVSLWRDVEGNLSMVRVFDVNWKPASEKWRVPQPTLQDFVADTQALQMIPKTIQVEPLPLLWSLETDGRDVSLCAVISPQGIWPLEQIDLLRQWGVFSQKVSYEISKKGFTKKL